MAIECYKLDIGGINFGAWNQISLHFNFDNATVDPQYIVAKGLIDDFNADRMATYRGLFPNEYGVQWIRAKRVSVGGGQSRTLEYITGTAVGTRAGDVSSLATAPIVKLYPAMGLNTSGRIFLPAISDQDLVENNYTGGYETAVANFFTSLQTWNGSISGNDWALAIHSKKLGIFTPVISHQLSATVGNMGKRRVPR